MKTLVLSVLLMFTVSACSHMSGHKGCSACAEKKESCGKSGCEKSGEGEKCKGGCGH